MAGIIGALATRGTHLVAPLVIQTVDLFEPQELLEFFGFLGMLAHRLRVSRDVAYSLGATNTDESPFAGRYQAYTRGIVPDSLRPRVRTIGDLSDGYRRGHSSEQYEEGLLELSADHLYRRVARHVLERS